MHKEGHHGGPRAWDLGLPGRVLLPPAPARASVGGARVVVKRATSPTSRSSNMHLAMMWPLRDTAWGGQGVRIMGLGRFNEYSVYKGQ